MKQSAKIMGHDNPPPDVLSDEEMVEVDVPEEAVSEESFPEEEEIGENGEDIFNEPMDQEYEEEDIKYEIIENEDGVFSVPIGEGEEEDTEMEIGDGDASK